MVYTLSHAIKEEKKNEERVGSFGIKRESKVRHLEERKEKEKRRIEKRGKERARVCGNRGSFFSWVFYPLVISEVVYCSHDSDFSSEMKYIFP